MLNNVLSFLIAFKVGVIPKCCVFQIFFTHNEEEEIENRTKLADNLKTALRTQSMRWVLKALLNKAITDDRPRLLCDVIMHVFIITHV